MLVSRLVYGIGMVHLGPIVVIDIEAACPADAGWRGRTKAVSGFCSKVSDARLLLLDHKNRNDYARNHLF